MQAITRLQGRAQFGRRRQRAMPKNNATKAYVKRVVDRNQELNLNKVLMASSNVSYDVPKIQLCCNQSKCIFKSGMNYNIQFDAAQTANDYPTIRYLIIQYTQTNTTAPTMLQLLGSTGLVTDVFLPHNYSFRKSFHVLLDRTIQLGNNSVTYPSAIPRSKVVRGVIPLSRFQRKGYAEADELGKVKGGIYFMAISDVLNSATPPTVVGHFRILNNSID